MNREQYTEATMRADRLQSLLSAIRAEMQNSLLSHSGEMDCLAEALDELAQLRTVLSQCAPIVTCKDD